jgi:hypothetical protein
MHSLCQLGIVLSIDGWLLDSYLLNYQLKASPSATEVVASTPTSEETELSSYLAALGSESSQIEVSAFWTRVQFR